MFPSLGHVLVPLAIAGTVISCGSTVSQPGPTQPPIRSISRAPRAEPAPVVESFWHPVTLEFEPGIAPPSLPIDETAFLADASAKQIWGDLRLDEREALLANGVVFRKQRAFQSFGEALRRFAGEGTPTLVGVETLFELVRVTFRTSLEDVLGPSFVGHVRNYALAAKAKLEMGAKNAGSDLQKPYEIAIDYLSVLAHLADPATKLTNARQRRELEAMDSAKHASESPVLRVPLPYPLFRASAACEKGLLRACRLKQWMDAPLYLSIEHNEGIDRSTARAHLRAALLLAQTLNESGDKTAIEPYEKVDRALSFFFGAPDDLSLLEFSRIAKSERIGLPEIANVVKLHEFSKRIDKRTPPKMFDPFSALLEAHETVDPAHVRSVRIFGGRISPDSQWLQRVALFSSTMPKENAQRPTPDPIDIGAWMGIPEAIAEREKAFGAQKKEYGLLLERSGDLFPPSDSNARHASVYASFLDMLEHLGRSQVAYEAIPACASPVWRSHLLSSALGLWTAMRSDIESSTPLREPVGQAALRPAPSWIDPHPEAIAQYLSMVRQLRDGLLAFRFLAEGSPHRAIVDETERVLLAATRLSESLVNDRESEVPPELLASIVSLLDRHPTPEGTHASVHFDLAQNKVTRSTRTAPFEAVVVLREPKSHTLRLAKFATTELVQSYETFATK